MLGGTLDLGKASTMGFGLVQGLVERMALELEPEWALQKG